MYEVPARQARLLLPPFSVDEQNGELTATDLRRMKDRNLDGDTIILVAGEESDPHKVTVHEGSREEAQASKSS